MNDRTKLRGWPRWVWAVILLLEVLFVVAVLTPGVRQYLLVRRFRRARSTVQALAKGIVRCAGAGLPESTAPVPSPLPTGKQYVPAAADWNAEPAFRCAGFAPSEPQYFAYQWRRDSATEGAAIAVADFDANGEPDAMIEQRVQCETKDKCRLDSPIERRPLE